MAKAVRSSGGDAQRVVRVEADLVGRFRVAAATREQAPVAGHEGSVLGVVQFRDVNVFYFCNLSHFLVDLDP